MYRWSFYRCITCLPFLPALPGRTSSSSVPRPLPSSAWAPRGIYRPLAFFLKKKIIYACISLNFYALLFLFHHSESKEIMGPSGVPIIPGAAGTTCSVSVLQLLPFFFSDSHPPGLLSQATMDRISPWRSCRRRPSALATPC